MSVQLQTRATHSLENTSSHTFQNLLLLCGAASSVLYVFMNIICAIQYPGYNSFSLTVSELSAIGTPTRTLWVSLATLYDLLVIAFGIGLWQSTFSDKRIWTIGIILIINAVIGFFWPPMHQRQVIASGGGTMTDTLHIVFTFITVPLMITTIILGAVAFGKRFRLYSITTLVVLLLFGMLVGIDSPGISTNSPTPWIGLWERINIGAYMLWIFVFSLILYNKNTRLAA